MSALDQVTKPDEGTPAENLLDQLVGEGKRYADSEALAKGRLEADSYIKQLEEENKGLRSGVSEMEKELERAKGVEDLLANARKGGGESGTDNQSAGVDADAVQAIVDKSFERHQTESIRRANRDKVDAAVTAAHGDQAVTFLKEKSKELGLTADALRNLSSESPAALMQLLGLSPASTSTSPTFTDKNQMNSETVVNRGPEVRNESYYRAKRKEMGTAAFYADTTLQKQKFKDAQELGADYFQ